MSNCQSFLSTLSLRRATPGENHANSQQEFLSTLSLRRATIDTIKDVIKTINFYPRSPCGERRQKHINSRADYIISIHALLAESDGADLSSCFGRIIFLSTLSLRRATLTPSRMSSRLLISIHALLAESDVFLSCNYPFKLISIHALLAESDAIRICQIIPIIQISIHALLAESDHMYHRVDRGTAYISIHALLAESDSMRIDTANNFGDFYPRSPCGERRL